MADYDRAVRMLAPALNGLVVGGTANVTWMPDGRFWYARTTAAAMGLELLEATVENSAGVGEAAASVVARGAQAIWVSGDSTVQQGIGALIRAATQGKIPVFTLQPGDVEKGALFDIGLNFYDIGRETSKIVVQVLEGTPISRIPSATITTRYLLLNTAALANLRDPWRAPPELVARAKVIIDEHGRREQGENANAAGEKR